MYRKPVFVVAVLAFTAILAGACTVPAPVQRTWKVQPKSIQVIDQEDWDAGDEPYVIQLGFRSKLGVPNSSSAFVTSQCRSGALAANNVGTPGTVVPIPPDTAQITFPDVQNLDVGDVLLETAPLEIFGTLAFVMERDVIIPGACGVTDMLNNVLTGVLADALDLLIAGADVPPTQDALIDLIVNNLGNFLSAVPGMIAINLEGLGNPDDVLGIAAQIFVPAHGAFADLLNFGLRLAGFDQGVIELPDLDIPPTLKFRVGNLLPSTTSFTFAGSGYETKYTSSVTRG